MKLQYLPAALLAVFVCTAAAAQQAAPIRAVEHPEYSRLVLPLPAGADWSLSQDGSRAALRLTGPVPDLDVSSVFQRMPRTRILSVSARTVPGGATLELTLACACEVVPAPIGTGFLAIDVRRPDGAPATERIDPRPMKIGAAAGAAQRPGPRAAPASQAAAPDLAAAGPGSNATAPPTLGGGGSDTTDAVLAARDQLMASLERAADEGLLTIAPEVATSIAPLAADLAIAEAAPGRLPAATVTPAPSRTVAEVAAPGLDAHLSIRGPLDPARRADADTETTPQACLNDEALHVASWNAGEEFAEGLGQRRRLIISPAGDLDFPAIEDLARFYISSGFGREAQALLGVTGGTGDARRLLQDLARVVDGQPPDPLGPIASAAACDGRISLWRAAAGLDTGSGRKAADKAVLAGIEELPVPLRRVVAAAVVRNALANDRPDLARDILGVLDRTPGDGGRGEVAMRAAVLLSEGQAGAALALTAPVLATASSPDPDLLLAHAQATLQTGSSVAPALTTGLDAAIAALPDAPGVARDLRLVRIRLEAAQGRPIAALRALRGLEADPGSKDPELRAVGLDILEAMPAEQRRSLAGAHAALENKGIFATGSRGAALRTLFAGDLIRGGLPNAGSALLAAGSEIADRDARLMAAAARLAEGDPRGALTALDGLTGADAARVRARSHIRLGDLPAAAAAMSGPGTNASADTRRDALSLLAVASDSTSKGEISKLYAPLSAYLSRRTEPVPGTRETGPTLDRARAALHDVPTLLAAVSAMTPREDAN
ncbi:hypothetical protein GE300_19600 [Rhodobacteraceae bacterium 2CG4]|uniref:HEAT repeat protein n=1 Tax=Halovulum marinum TaxID=2662447 RepID=A0A6L5Z6Y8_9RHOB|nr:hypothetical protein [Halovulum marinum]MSU91785.1 hypothetical protein [Halovulum marinum]